MEYAAIPLPAGGSTDVAYPPALCFTSAWCTHTPSGALIAPPDSLSPGGSAPVTLTARYTPDAASADGGNSVVLGFQPGPQGGQATLAATGLPVGGLAETDGQGEVHIRYTAPSAAASGEDMLTAGNSGSPGVYATDAYAYQPHRPQLWSAVPQEQADHRPRGSAPSACRGDGWRGLIPSSRAYVPRPPHPRTQHLGEDRHTGQWASPAARVAIPRTSPRAGRGSPQRGVHPDDVLEYSPEMALAPTQWPYGPR